MEAKVPIDSPVVTSRQRIQESSNRIVRRTQTLMRALKNATTVPEGMLLIISWVVEMAPMIQAYEQDEEAYLQEMLKSTDEADHASE